MPRSAEAIHVIEKKSASEHLCRVPNKAREWETGYWVVGDRTAKSLIGGTVFVHRGQKIPSHAGGTILGVYHEPGTDPRRRVIRFTSTAAAKNVMADPSGWGYERKVVWRLDPVTNTRIVNDDDESAFPEGKKKYVLHHTRERDSAITRKAKRQRLKATGKLECEVCGFDFCLAFGERGEGFIEAHHTTPVAVLDGKTITRVKDLALVCSNCHRMLHRGKPLSTVEGLRAERSGEL